MARLTIMDQDDALPEAIPGKRILKGSDILNDPDVQRHLSREFQPFKVNRRENLREPIVPDEEYEFSEDDEVLFSPPTRSGRS